MTIRYEINRAVSVDEFIDVLNRSTLGERRPTEDRVTMEGMVNNTPLIITAWHDDLLVGVSRSVTDFHFACYLSDLAVDTDYQRRGIGKQLIQLTRDQLGEKCQLILISAPAANEYYPKLGFERNDRTWILPQGVRVDR